VIKSDNPADLANMIGYNFRMGEIEAAIAAVQLDKLKARVESRQRAARQLDEALGELQGLTTPRVETDGTHVYYVYGLTLDVDHLGVSRQKLVDALRAEGVPALAAGYQNLHLLPIFTHKIAYGTRGFPWTLAEREIAYGPGTCPVAEELHSKTFVGINLCACEFSPEDVEMVIGAFRKVWDNLDALKG
jgi:dTDP-4-amino-4,6-dideoxygalactose transaminase